jgi:hypothetical protein
VNQILKSLAEDDSKRARLTLLQASAQIVVMTNKVRQQLMSEAKIQ